jgi:AcrR family transcriptional regulator
VTKVKRGRPPVISRERIVETALELGVENLTLKAVADRLGVHPTALKRHVGDRAGLGEQVATALLQFNLREPVTHGPGDWRSLLRAFAHELRRVLRASAPAFALIDHLPAGAASLRQLDRLYESLLAADPAFDPILAAKAIAFTGQVAYVSVRDELLIHAEGRHPLDRRLAEDVAAAGSSGLAGLRQYLESRDLIDADAQFEFNLDCVIGGIEVALVESALPRGVTSQS